MVTPALEGALRDRSLVAQAPQVVHEDVAVARAEGRPGNGLEGAVGVTGLSTDDVRVLLTELVVADHPVPLVNWTGCQI